MPSATMCSIWLLVPVAGVGEHRPRPLAHAGLLELAQRGVDHRLELPEVRGLGRDLRGDDDLLLGDRRPARCSPGSCGCPWVRIIPRVGVGRVDLALGHQRRRVRRWRAARTAGRHCIRRGRAVVLIAPVGGVLDRELLIHPALRFRQPLLARPRDRPRVSCRAAASSVSPALHATTPHDPPDGSRTDPDRAQARPWRSPPHPPPARRHAQRSSRSRAASSAARRPSRVRNCSGSSSPRASPIALVLFAVDPLGLARGSRPRSTHSHGCGPATRSRASWSRRPRSPRPSPAPPPHTATAPRRTARRSRSRAGGGTPRSSSDPAPPSP